MNASTIAALEVLLSITMGESSDAGEVPFYCKISFSIAPMELRIGMFTLIELSYH